MLPNPRRQNVAIDVAQSERPSQTNVNIGGNQYRMQLRPPAYQSYTSKLQSAVSAGRHSTVTPRTHDTWQRIDPDLGPLAVGNREVWIPTHLANWRQHLDPRYPISRGAAGSEQRREYDENLGWVMTNLGVHNMRITNQRYGAANRISNFYVYRIYTMIRVWMRKAIETVRQRWLTAARLPQVIGNRGGSTRFAPYPRGTSVWDAGYAKSLQQVLPDGKT